MTKLFHNISYLSVPFAVAAMYYIFHGSLLRPINFVEEIGLGIFFMGFAFAFGGMSDIKKISKKEVEIFTDSKRFKHKVYSLIIIGVVALFACLVFISLKWIGGNKLLADKYYNLGLNLMPSVIAIFFELKQFYDKKSYFDLINE